MAQAPLHDSLAGPHARAALETRYTTCYMSACGCGIRVQLRDGEVRYIEGNPDNPLNQGLICANGSSRIMKQYSPARLTKPLLRKPGSERGDRQFVPIEWDQALLMLEQRLQQVRATDPKQFALFTGRDQMQALTGLFARKFGTPKYAAHGGLCSVNMAAGMIYTMGGSFNTREFFHGYSIEWLSGVKWAFLPLVFPLPLLGLAAGVATGSGAWLAAAFVLQYLGLLAARWFYMALARQPQNLSYQAIS